jgi:hypothetical protein
MDIDSAPRRKTIPLWVWFVVGAVFLYLALWAATFVAAQRHVRDLRAEYQAHIPHGMILLKSYEATTARPKLAPDDRQWYVFVGNFSCPCPLITRMDSVAYQARGGIALRLHEIWLGNRWKEIGRKVYWAY